MGGGMALWLAFWTLFGIVLFALAVVALAWLVRNFNTPRGQSGSGDGGDALRTLERRYASGEITRDEYLQCREDLERHATPPART
jgi:putative membrane protein